MVYDITGINIGRNLKKVRLDLNLTQEEIANKLSKKRTFISRMESTNTNLTLNTLRAIVEDGLGGKLKIIVEI